MIKVKHRKADLAAEKIFQAKYLGFVSTNEPGVAGIEQAVRKIYDNVKLEEKSCPKITLEVCKEGLKITEAKRHQDCRFYPIKDMSYCTLNRYETCIFAFNHHVSKSPRKVECHAVMCNSEEKAKDIALALYSAFREGHFEELRKERKSGTLPRKEDTGSEGKDVCETYSSNGDTTSVETTKVGVIDGEEKELDNIVKDMLATVERESATLKNKT
ncbi:predicted protein [Nematostella vectensis]|uniref:PID domain-containing protein n=2 Tax=Nematostella vectensis TaxID=45351 RepID=A7RTC9_NEMVE|nr:predicted protein [Nematostella vectensis]|eukprot:XP_001637310.1 predicted protein [Nematostella vectensis]